MCLKPSSARADVSYSLLTASHSPHSQKSRRLLLRQEGYLTQPHMLQKAHAPLAHHISVKPRREAQPRATVAREVQSSRSWTDPNIQKTTGYHERDLGREAIGKQKCMALHERGFAAGQALYSLDCSRRHVSMQSAKYCTLFSLSPAIEMRPDFSKYTWNSFVRRTQTGSGRPV